MGVPINEVWLTYVSDTYPQLFRSCKKREIPLKTEKGAALLLVAAAIAGLAIANSPFGSALFQVKQFEFGIGAFQIDVAHFVSEFLLSIFFLLAGLELKHELRIGALSNIRVAVVPIGAAFAGVVFPTLIYLSLNPSPPTADGWPIPAATDIAFALGVLALIGKGLPPVARVFLLALAIFDDLIAILIIATIYTSDLNVAWLLTAATLVVLLRFLFPRVPSKTLNFLLFTFFLLTWWAVYNSGVHATVAGVLIGISVPAKATHVFVKRIQPICYAVILPVFAFMSVSILIPTEFSFSSSVFLGIALALPIGKLMGIGVGGFLLNKLAPTESRLALNFVDFTTVGLLAGIGFTVSLLLAELSFSENPVLATEAVAGVIAGSLISVLLAIIAVQLRNWFSRR